MHWGQIKSILILSFFILDIYLFAQFLEKKEQADIGVLEQQTSTIEEQLQAESITYNDLPEEVSEETFISVNRHRFKEEDLNKAKPKQEQETFIVKGSTIVSELEDPVKMNTTSVGKIMEVFHDTVYYADEYDYWNWNKAYNVIIFFQNKMDRPVYYNQNGVVIAILNDDNEMVSYVQTMLGDEEALADKRQLIKPLTAIEKVYEEGELHQGDEVSKVNIGFHTRVPFEGGVQVFAPTWRIDVNEGTNYFVNAIEGFMFLTEEEEFLKEILTSIANNANDEEDSALSNVKEELKNRLQQTTE